MTYWYFYVNLKFHFYIPSGYGYIFSADADETLVDAHAVLSPYSSQQKTNEMAFYLNCLNITLEMSKFNLFHEVNKQSRLYVL